MKLNKKNATTGLIIAVLGAVVVAVIQFLGGEADPQNVEDRLNEVFVDPGVEAEVED